MCRMCYSTTLFVQLQRYAVLGVIAASPRETWCDVYFNDRCWWQVPSFTAQEELPGQRDHRACMHSRPGRSPEGGIIFRLTGWLRDATVRRGERAALCSATRRRVRQLHAR